METVLALGVIGDTASLSADLLNLLVNYIIPLMGVAFVALTWKATKSAGPTFVAVIAAAAIWWAVDNMELLKDKAGEDLKQSAPAVQVERPRSGSGL